MTPARSVLSEPDREALIKYVRAYPLPFMCQLTKGLKRTTKQNRLQRQWMNDIATQLPDYNAEGWRGYFKLRVGVPIRKANDEEFARVYDEKIRPLPYEVRHLLMQEPMDLPVTRDFNAKQMAEYLEGVAQFAAERGVILTDPAALEAASVEGMKR